MTVPPRGRLIALEGIDGSGKTTQARLLAESVGAVLTHEPGATDLGRAVRELVLAGEGQPPVPRAEALLMAADRAQHVAEIVLPALEAGVWVVSDRFSGSTLAYQGFGRGIPEDELQWLVEWATGGLQPDLSVLVDVPVEEARRRLGSAAPDRLERLDEAFFARVRQGYLDLASDDPRSWIVVDGTYPVEKVAGDIAAAVVELLGPQGDGEVK